MILTCKYYTENYVSKNKFELKKNDKYRNYINDINKNIDSFYKRGQLTCDKKQLKEYKDIINFLNKRKSEILKVNR